MHKGFNHNSVHPAMKYWMYFLGFIIVSLFSVLDSAQVIEGPVDTTGEIGMDMNLTCRYSMLSSEVEAVRWSMFVDSDKPQGEAIFTYPVEQQPEDSSKYQILQYEDHLDLQIKNADFYDGGRYICSLVVDNTQSQEATLIVLSRPTAITPPSANQVGETIDLSCEVTFAAPRENEISAAQQPVLKTFLGSTQLTLTEDVVVPGTPGTMWWSMRQTAQVTVTDDHNGLDLICSIETGSPYYYLEAREPVWVLHAVSEVIIPEKKDIYFVGDIVNCSANGNPEPDYEWQPIEVPQMTGSRTYQTSQLEITSSLIGQNKWKCIASNSVGGKVIREIEVDFEVQPSPYAAGSGESKSGGSSTVAIALGVVIPLVVIGILLVVGFIIYKTKYKKDDENTPPPVVPKDLPPNPKPPKEMKIFKPQVYDPEEGNPVPNGRREPERRREPEYPDQGSGSALLGEPARPLRPPPMPRSHPPPQQQSNVSQPPPPLPTSEPPRPQPRYHNMPTEDPNSNPATEV